MAKRYFSDVFVLFAILCVIAPVSSTTRFRNCSEVDREALIDFKNGLQDPEDVLSSWTGGNCCKWQGVHCDRTSGAVMSIDLRNPNTTYLFGEIRPSLLRLKSLRYLDLSSTLFQGAIPQFLGHLKNLEYLNLSHSGFVGTIPANLGNLSSLQYLDLSVGFPSINVDDVGWMTDLASLKYLALDGVDLSKVGTKWIQILINRLPFLSELHLAGCRLSGSLSSPSIISTNFTSLTVLDISQNSFGSMFPEWVMNLSSLVHLDMSYISGRGLYGKLPLGLGELPNLEFLDLSGNDLSASCSQLFGGTWRNIQVVNLSGNKVQGRIPPSIGNMTSLTHFDLSSNIVEREIPSSIGSLCSLAYFNLFSNNLAGSLPKVLQDGSGACTFNKSLPNLMILDMSYNQLHGYLPNWLGQLENLAELDLSDNFLLGTVPSLGKLKKLFSLNLSGNQLNGTLPVDLGQLSELQLLDAYNNQLSGTLSEQHFANLSKLSLLDLSSNPFILNVSTNWSPPFQVKYLFMGSCKLNSPFPAWLKSQNSIQGLDFSEAGMSGPIPSWFWNVSQGVYFLDLHANQLTGQLPNSTKAYYFLEVVDLSFNLFRGPIPLLKNAMLLDLSNNQFAGPLPENIDEHMPNLHFLSLSSNQITGQIPNFGVNSELTVIDLSNNNLNGNIPSSMGDISLLRVLDLQKNALSGLIPESLGQLADLQSLHLSNNKLSGNIPSSFKSLSSLKTLDLAHNQMTGGIPAWINYNFTELSILSLRSNAFSGEIPSHLSNLTSLQVLDLAENKLTGRIPSSLGDLKAMVHKQDKKNYFLTYGQYAGVYYMERFIINMKNQAQLYSRTLSLVTSIDLSSNHLGGDFPRELANLMGLLVLNLSRNYITGQIPDSISGMGQLGSLDLSNNRLSGPIPEGISSLSFMGYLNLSNNNLSGKIPYTLHTTTFGPSSFYGNPGLCGDPLNIRCEGDEPTRGGTTEASGSDGSSNKDEWFHLSAGLGFATGILVPAVVLHVRKTWCDIYSDFIDRIVGKRFITERKRVQRNKKRAQGGYR